MKIAESKVSPQFSVTVPRAVRLAYEVEPADVMVWCLEDGRLFIEMKKSAVSEKEKVK